MARYFFLIFISLLSLPTFAHNLLAIAHYDGQILSGKAYYSDQTPASETYFEVFQGSENTPMMESKTDKEGRFSLQITSNQLLKVVVEGMEGHRAETLASPLTNQIENNELSLIREEIHQLKNKIWLRDIIGGIGYILGLFGLFALFKKKN